MNARDFVNVSRDIASTLILKHTKVIIEGFFVFLHPVYIYYALAAVVCAASADHRRLDQPDHTSDLVQPTRSITEAYEVDEE